MKSIQLRLHAFVLLTLSFIGHAFLAEKAGYVVSDRLVLPKNSRPYAEGEPGDKAPVGKLGAQKGSLIDDVAKVPESPQTEAYVPTKFKDLQATTPDEAILSMPPPTANNTGTFSTALPLKLPPGRSGVQPELALRYNSEGGYSWVGQGFDLNIPCVSIETRWGVPRYDTELETESYLLEGAALFPVVHREELKDRQADKRFYPRVEGNFRRIVRHGNSPENYWWEVVEKDGRRRFYGGSPSDNGVQNDAVLRDGPDNGSGNIAHWALREIRDANGNFVRYHYEIAESTGLPNGMVMGRQIYPRKITYTGHGTAEGPFAVVFERDNGERRDVQINCLLGFKQVTTDRLQRVDIQYNGTTVCAYDFTYTEGAFFKSLLSAVREKGQDGTMFTEHEFTYFDDVRQNGLYKPFENEDAWDVPNDDIKIPLASGLIFDDGASVISGSKSTSWGVGLSLTVGPLGSATCKTNTIGGNFSFNGSSSDGLTALVDINGDGLADKVFRQGNDLMYRANLSGPDNVTTFSTQAVKIEGITDISHSKTRGNSKGVEANASAFFASGSWSKSTTINDIYFADFNGDRLIDLARKGRVYFNHLENGQPTFTLNSNDTPSPIIAGSALDTTLVTLTAAEQQEIIEENPLHDMVRMWKAPFTGGISISGAVTLLEDNSAEAVEYPYEDGVKACIQYQQNNYCLQIEPIQAGTPLIIPGVPPTLQVEKGDRIYFRIQSRADGAFDKVHWAPQIDYQSIAPTLNLDFAIDANNKNVRSYSAQGDFVLSAPVVVGLPVKGGVVVEIDFEKDTTSDDISLEIIRRYPSQHTDTLRHFFAWDTTVQTTLGLTLDVEAEEEIVFRVVSSTNVDWPGIRCEPRLFYTSFASGMDALDENGNYFLEMSPVPELTMFNKMRTVPLRYVVPDIGLDTTPVRISPFQLEDVNLPIPQGAITLSAKGVNKLYGKVTFKTGNLIQQPFIGLDSFLVRLPPGEAVFIEYHIANDTLADYIQTHVAPGLAASIPVRVRGQWRDAGVFTRPDTLWLGPLYRGWGHFAYNGNLDRAGPIHEDELDEPPLQAPPGDIPDEPELNNDQLAEYDPTAAHFVTLYPDGALNAWRGFDDLTWLGATELSSSRFGEDNLRLDYAPSDSAEAVAVRKITRHKTTNVAFGASAGFIGSTLTYSLGNTEFLYSSQDFNHDGYPDVASPNKVQYTTMRGGLEETARYHGLGNQKAASEQFGASTSGSVSQAKTARIVKVNTGPNGTAQAKTANMDNQCADAQKAAGASMNGSVNLGISFGSDKTADAWVDMNGDGLPDKVYDNGEVALNLGYRFAPKEVWNFGFIQRGRSDDVSGGGALGFSWHNGSITAGISLSKTNNRGTLIQQDVNADGLVDFIRQDSGSTLIFARINYGNGFSPDILWLDQGSIDEGESVGESINAAFTYCFPVWLFRVCFNPSGNLGRGVSRQESQLTDIDGDGFADYLFSGSDDQLAVRRSTIGRTNLLKSVERPMQSSFTVDYARAGNTYAMPMNKWVLSLVELYDGLDDDGADYQKWAFMYTEGVFDRHEREFYGFGTVISRQLDTGDDDAVYRTRVQQFDNSSYYRKGLLLSDTLFAGDEISGKKYTASRQNWQLKDIFSGTVFLPNDYPEAGGTAFPALLETEYFSFEGQPTAGLATRMTYAYDMLGNITGFTDSGDSATTDLVQAYITYHNHPDIKSVPKSIEVYTGGSTTWQRRRETEMDGLGNLTKIRQYLTDDTTAVFDMTYDDYGNLHAITRPANSLGQRLSYDYRYDDEVHTYVIETHDTYGYRSTAVYDPRYGKLLLSRDINGHETHYTLDVFGRIATITGPYEIASGAPYTLQFEYHPEAVVPYAITRHYDPESGGNIETVTFTDGLGRPVQVKKTGVVGAAETAVWIVSGRVKFDAFGRSTAAWYPTTEALGNATDFNPDSNSIAPTITAYDVLDRTLSTALPDGATTVSQYDIATDNNGRACTRITTTDALGNTKEAYADVRGRTRATKDNGPNDEIWTNYRFNALSELLAVTDAGGNTISYQYDRLGRKWQINHPDAGVTELSFDLAGNLLRKITANIREVIPNGGAVVHTYEYERLIQIDYPKNFQNRVVFTYGDSAATHNRRGRLYLQEDASGGQELFFGPLGEITKAIRTLLPQKDRLLTYVWTNEYDTWNRIQKMTYPDGEEVEYDYNAAGQLRNIHSHKLGREYTIVNKIAYDEFGQRVLLELGNGTVTHYHYQDARRRLEHLDVTGPGGKVIMNNAYDYDAVDNILSVSNSMPVEDFNLGGPATHTYTYDNLYRLTAATGTWKGFSQARSYALVMEYDNLNNIMRKNQQVLLGSQEIGETTHDRTYVYDGARPHIPTRIGSRNFSYDANGNLTGWREQLHFERVDLKWDEENRLESVWDNGHLSLYTYDARGERALKSDGGVTAVFMDGAPAGYVNHFDNWTAYVSPYFVTQDRQFTKHYFIENQRIASREGAGRFEHPYLPGPRLTAGALDYTERIVQLEQAALQYYLSYNQPPGEPVCYNFAQQPEVTGNPIPVLATGNYDNPPGWPQGPPPPLDFTQPPGEPVKFGASITNDNVQAGFNFQGVGDFGIEANQYFFHADHLGSASYVTDALGRLRQHAEYLPFGEAFVEEFMPGGAQDYLFNAKEYDRETGLYYYGARYYDPRLAMWLSVDPMAEKYPGWSPYNYTMLNPVKYVDPDGREHKKPSLISQILDSGTTMNIVQSAADVSAKFADGYTAGLMNNVLQLAGLDVTINDNSKSSAVGEYLGSGMAIAMNVIPGYSGVEYAMAGASMLIDVAQGEYVNFATAAIGLVLSEAGSRLIPEGLGGKKFNEYLEGAAGELFGKGSDKFFDNIGVKEKSGIDRKFELDPVFPEAPKGGKETGQPGQRLFRRDGSGTGRHSEQ